MEQVEKRIRIHESIREMRKLIVIITALLSLGCACDHGRYRLHDSKKLNGQLLQPGMTMAQVKCIIGLPDKVQRELLVFNPKPSFTFSSITTYSTIWKYGRWELWFNEDRKLYLISEDTWKKESQ